MPTVSIGKAKQNRAWETAASASDRYVGLDRKYSGGIWRDGKGGSKRTDSNPFSGETLLEFVQANRTDLDEAYQSAAKAQVRWEDTNCAERAAIMLRSSRIMEHRRDEIVDWLVRESGSTRMKAELEWHWVYSITVEAASAARGDRGHKYAVVAKPADDTPVTRGFLLAKIFCSEENRTVSCSHPTSGN